MGIRVWAATSALLNDEHVQANGCKFSLDSILSCEQAFSCEYEDRMYSLDVRDYRGDVDAILRAFFAAIYAIFAGSNVGVVILVNRSSSRLVSESQFKRVPKGEPWMYLIRHTQAFCGIVRVSTAMNRFPRNQDKPKSVHVACVQF